MIPLALLFSFNILMTGGNLLGIHARFAKQLDLPGAWIIPWLPVIATVAYGLAVFGLRYVKKKPLRWCGFILATFVGHWMVVYPIQFFENKTVPIRLSTEPDKEALGKFSAAYPVKWALSPISNRDLVVLRVRREDYSEAMAQFLKDLAGQEITKKP